VSQTCQRLTSAGELDVLEPLAQAAVGRVERAVAGGCLRAGLGSGEARLVVGAPDDQQVDVRGDGRWRDVGFDDGDGCLRAHAGGDRLGDRRLVPYSDSWTMRTRFWAPFAGSRL
jgi:hypothetical protein